MLAAGCASNSRPADVPSTAILETGGRERLVYVPSNSGMLYISDQNDRAILYSGRVLAGDHIVVDPDANRVAINDRVVVSENVGHETHRIYLLPGAIAPPPAALSSVSVRVARPADVPPTAVLGAEGRDRVEYTASTDGVMWVADATRNSVVYRTRVIGGDRVTVDPSRNGLMVNGTRAYNGDLPSGDYRIFFAPGTGSTGVVARTGCDRWAHGSTR